MERSELVGDLVFNGLDNTSSVPTTPEQLTSTIKFTLTLILMLTLILTKSKHRSFKPSRILSYQNLTHASNKMPPSELYLKTNPSTRQPTRVTPLWSCPPLTTNNKATEILSTDTERQLPRNPIQAIEHKITNQLLSLH